MLRRCARRPRGGSPPSGAAAKAFASPTHRAADAYVVRRGRGRTITAGYPWFTDWGRDTFIAALWLNALGVVRAFDQRWTEPIARGLQAFEARFWNPDRQCLDDVVDVDHRAGTADATLRPNQIFAVGGLPRRLVGGDRAAAIVAAVERELWMPMGLRSPGAG